MPTASKLDAHHARVRDALILPFKRKMASLIIRTDIWKDDPGSEARSRAHGAIAEVDDQVTLLQDLKLPGEKKARESEADVKRLIDAFGAMRLTLVGMAGTASAA